MSNCYYCKCRTYPGPKTGRSKPDTATRDHLIPRSRGGTALPGNTVNACYACNQEKGVLTATEYLAVLMYRKGQELKAACAEDSRKRTWAAVVRAPKPNHDVTVSKPDYDVIDWTLDDLKLLYETGVSCE